MAVKLNQTDLQEIVRRSGLNEPDKLSGASRNWKVVEYAGRLYKVRSYENSEIAERQLELISGVKHLFTECYGRIGRNLILAYIQNSKLQNNPEDFFLLGSFLGELVNVQICLPPQDDFELWCNELVSMKVFRNSTLERIKDYYREHSSNSLIFGLEYFDARLKNFALTEAGEFLSIDEKHVRVGPLGVSFAKPKLRLTGKEFQAVKEGYLSKTNRFDFDDARYFDFLTLYHSIYALRFKVINSRSEIYKRSKTFQLRRQIVMRVIQLPLLDCSIEDPFGGFLD